MCADFDFEGQGTFRRIPPPTEQLIDRSREVESKLPGTPVPDDAWRVFFSVSCGVMDMGHFTRMFEARRIALSYMAVQRARFARRHGSATGFRCVAD